MVRRCEPVRDGDRGGCRFCIRTTGAEDEPTNLGDDLGNHSPPAGRDGALLGRAPEDGRYHAHSDNDGAVRRPSDLHLPHGDAWYPLRLRPEAVVFR